MRRILVMGLLSVAFHSAMAQKMKTGVLVVGNGSNAIGASIQSAVSGAKTILLLPDPGIQVARPTGLTSGIEHDLLKRMDSTKTSAAAALKAWTDTLKNLTVVRGTPWTKIKKSGSGWSVELQGGKSIKAAVLVHAERSGKLSSDLQLPATSAQWKPFQYDDFSYRRSLASGFKTGTGTASVLSLESLLLPSIDNLVLLRSEEESLAAGQAAGATAAYAAFYEKKTSEAKLKSIQGELVNYKLSLLPFADISPVDSNWKAIQFFGLSGFVKAEIDNGTAYFRPDRKVSLDEVREPIKSFYYKAQIWFDDHKEQPLSIDLTLKMIAYVGGVSLEHTRNEVKKNWNSVYHLSGSFDGEREISRREFAALAHQYLKPFNVNIDKSGKVQR